MINGCLGAIEWLVRVRVRVHGSEFQVLEWPSFGLAHLQSDFSAFGVAARAADVASNILRF